MNYVMIKIKRKDLINMKRVTCILLVFSILASLFVLNVSANEDLMQEEIQLGDYVQFGTYLGEPILWRYVISDKNGKMLISDKQLSMKCYSGGTNQNGQGEGETTWGNNDWSISDIRSWLNSSASTGEVEWLDGTPPDENASFRGYNPYDDEAGFLSSTNFSEDDLKLIKAVQLKTYDKANIITNAEAIGSLSVSDIEIDLNDVEYTTTEDMMFLPDLVDIKKMYDNSDVLGDHYYYAIASEKAIEHHGTSYGSDEWDIWLRCPDYTTLNTEYDEGVHVSTLGKGELYQDGVSQGVVYHIGWRASCGSDLTGIRPAFYLEDEFEINSGDGTSDSPYILSAPAEEILIYNESDLKQVTSGNNYKLMADIELSEPWTPLDYYGGTFDGNGHKISGLTLPTGYGADSFGLFYEVSNGTVKNLTVSVNISLGATKYITLGAIAGMCSNGNIINCHSEGAITLKDEGLSWLESTPTIGGICGYMYCSKIEDCTNMCQIVVVQRGSGFFEVGGISGSAGGDVDENGLIIGKSIIKGCTNKNLIANVSGGFTGGILACGSELVTISECSNIASISCTQGGGIAGDLSEKDAIISCSYNSGNITAESSRVGGIVGSSDGPINDCYNVGSITSESTHYTIGGIAGISTYHVANVYNIGIITSNGDFGNVFGASDCTEPGCYCSYNWYFCEDYNSKGCISQTTIENESIIENSVPLTSEQMKQKESFSTFDFETVWDINPEINDGYPYLRCFYEETTDAEFGISTADDGVAGSWFSFDVEFSSLPTSAYLQFDAPDDNWNWLSEEYCMNHETFKIPVADLTEENGKYVGTVTLIIYSTGNQSDSYNRTVRINADFDGTKKQSEVVKFKVEPIPEKPNRSFGNLYEQTSDPQEIDVYPQILSVSVQKDRGQYLMKVESFIAKNKDNVFFYWETDNGEFTGTSTKYDVAKLNAPEGATVTVTMGDGYGYISTKTIELPAID